MPMTTIRSRNASAINDRIIAQPNSVATGDTGCLGAFSVRLVPERVYLQRLAADDAVAALESGDDARVADFAPRRDRDLAMLEGAGADLDEGVVVVDVEDQRVLRDYQRLAGASDDRHLREHLRFQPAARIFHAAADLQRMRGGIDVRTDTVDHSVKDFIGKCGRDC